MIRIGDRVKCQIDNDVSCSKPGILGSVVAIVAQNTYEPNKHQIFVVWDNCRCSKPYVGGCNGYPYDFSKKYSKYFTTTNNINTKCDNKFCEHQDDPQRISIKIDDRPGLNYHVECFTEVAGQKFLDKILKNIEPAL